MLLLYGSYSGYHTQYFNVMVAMVMVFNATFNNVKQKEESTQYISALTISTMEEG
jgi:hypothetical protein